MSSDFVIELLAKPYYTVLKASAPMLVIALVVGLIISIFQATTQIQEQTLAFVPKIVAVLAIYFYLWTLDFKYFGRFHL